MLYNSYKDRVWVSACFSATDSPGLLIGLLLLVVCCCCQYGVNAGGGRQKVIVCHDFWATVCTTVRPMPSDHCLSCLSVTLVYCGQTVGHIVLDPAPSPPKGHTPHFSAHVCCGAGWIKMAFGREVGLGLGDIVLDGDPAPTSQKGGSSAPPLFGACLLWPNGGWIKMPLSSLPQNRGIAPNFWPMSIVAKRPPISATAEHLCYLMHK